MNVYLVCFDISDDGTRERVGRCLLEYGERVQKSVFEVVVADSAAVASVRDELISIMGDETNLRIYRLCADCCVASTTLHGDPVARFPGVVLC